MRALSIAARTALGVAMVVAAVAASIILSGNSAATAESPSSATIAARAADDAGRLAALPDLDATPLAGTVDARDARAASARYALEVPLPPGGNFNGIQWERAEAVSAADMQFTLQYNAACQWARAASVEGAAESVLAEVPKWPAMRTSRDLRDHWTRTSQAPGAGPALAECEASHVREVAYAKSLGLTPPR